jgi:hypothetical protein
MRHVQQPLVLAQDTAEFKLNFQMISSGARHACCVTIRATDAVQAATLFRENWPAIEELARKNLATRAAKELRLNLDAPPSPNRVGQMATSQNPETGLVGLPLVTLDEHFAQ